MITTKACIVMLLYYTLSITDGKLFLKENKTKILTARADDEDYQAYNTPNDDRDKEELSQKSCWLQIGIKRLFKVWTKLDESFDGVRKAYNNKWLSQDIDKVMLKSILEWQGKAARAVSKFDGHAHLIPAGINLGGYCMIKKPESILFFHRMKLRNNTHFTIRYLHSDMYDMTMTARLNLNDLHLLGDYDRSLTDVQPNNLIYRPTYGKVEVLLKDTLYKMEARYRMQQDRLVIVQIISTLTPKDILVSFKNNVSDCSTEKFSLKEFDPYLRRLHLDLDLWLKDYYNDFLTFFDHDKKKDVNFLTYDKQKAMILNEFVDKTLERFKSKLRTLRSISLRIPEFNIFASNGMRIKLSRGVIRGVETMHRRSVATGKAEGKTRLVDAIIGFGTLKVEYFYEAFVIMGLPPLHGYFILTADQLEMSLALRLVDDPESFDLKMQFYKLPREDHLTVEGAVNRRLANFKNILEHEILTIMTNMLLHTLGKLNALSKCDPDPPIPGHTDPGELFSQETTEPEMPDSDDEKRDNDPDKDLDDPMKADYGLHREDSVELVLPPEEGKAKGQKMKIKYKEQLAINKRP